MTRPAAVALGLGLLLGARMAAAAPTVTGAWIPVPPPGAKVLAGFMTLANAGPGDAALTGVASPLARKIEIHAMEMTDGVARMRLRESLDVPAGGTVTLAPGGLHLMIYIDAPAPERGARVPLALTFADGTRLDVEALVRPREDDGAPGDDGHHHHSP